MQTPLVTIAIPTYNRADSYLEDALKSASEQTYENIEILVSDNCSTDRTPEIIEAFDDPRLRYFRQEKNLGQRPNMNFLVEKAEGDYFLMFHDDDQIERDFVETCMKKANYRTDVGLILTGSRVIDKTGKVLRSKENRAEGLPFEEFALLWFKKGIHMFFCASLFNTKALRKAGGFLDKYDRYDDVAAEFICAHDMGRVDVRECKANFREHPESGSNATKLSSWCKSGLEIVDLACSLAPSKSKEFRSIGMQTAADRVYRYASETDSKFEQLKGYWTVYKMFGYNYFPSIKYFNKLIPFAGFAFHPYKSLSLLKGRIKNFTS